LLVVLEVDGSASIFAVTCAGKEDPNSQKRREKDNAPASEAKRATAGVLVPHPVYSVEGQYLAT